MLEQNQEFEALVNSVKDAHKKGRKCVLLLGAGCSVAAGIPSASEIVEKIKIEYPHIWHRTNNKNYPNLMSSLTPADRRDLLKKYFDNSRITWGYIAISQLIMRGYVDRILTPNFDDLVLRACALAGFFPAVYDLAVSENYNLNAISDPSIFHIHGQYTGFRIYNTPSEVERKKDKNKIIFEDTNKNRIWIVCGYSGNCDPIVQNLAELETDNGLYWVGYLNETPGNKLNQLIFHRDSQALWVSGFDADSFFVKLAQSLDCFPPDLVQQPIEYLIGIFEKISEFNSPDLIFSTKISNIVDLTKLKLKSINSYFEGKNKNIQQLYLRGKYEDVTEIFYRDQNNINIYDDDDKNLISISLFISANKISALIENDVQRNFKSVNFDLLDEALKKFKDASEICCDFFEAKLNYAVFLAIKILYMPEKDARKHWKICCTRFSELASQNNTNYNVYHIWGNCIYNICDKFGADFSIACWRDATEELAKIKPSVDSDTKKIFFKWGSCLIEMSSIKENDKKDDLHKILNNLMEIKLDNPKFADYEIACIHAKLGNSKMVKKFLENCANIKSLPTEFHLKNDKDLAPYIGERWFKSVIIKSKQQNSIQTMPSGNVGNRYMRIFSGIICQENL